MALVDEKQYTGRVPTYFNQLTVLITLELRSNVRAGSGS